MKEIRLRLGDQSETVRFDGAGNADIGSRRVPFEPGVARGALSRLTVEGRAHRVVTARDGDRLFVWCDGAVYVFDRVRGGRASSSSAGADHDGDLLAPMPGRVRRILVAAGQAVERGAALLALEAMKMEHTIRAPRAGVVERVLVAEGVLVDAGQELVALR